MTQPAPPDDHVLRYRVTAPDADALRSFIADSGADVSCRAVAVRTDEGLVTQVLLTRSQLGATRAASAVRVEEVEDVTAAQEAARGDVPTGDRFANRGDVPRGLGRKE